MSTFWPPVQIYISGRARFTCQFCDLASAASCIHTTAAASQFSSVEQGSACIVDSQEVLNPHTAATPKSDRVFSSFRALSVSNCKGCLKSDAHIWDLAVKGFTFKLPAPSHCVLCGTQRGEELKAMEGIIMTTMGPCNLSVHRYRCPNAACKSGVVSAEGRETS